MEADHMGRVVKSGVPKREGCIIERERRVSHVLECIRT